MTDLLIIKVLACLTILTAELFLVYSSYRLSQFITLKLDSSHVNYNNRMAWISTIYGITNTLIAAACLFTIAYIMLNAEELLCL